ncbi:unnamed protein product [Hermetia illucens]|uniref:DUF4485 domain-containing protein n=1 Tax=Hermetia illucens TaxID=343691 RepID=A0A7R8UHS6_HERIL|nr:unnamed protein product [Hermetia illucens]
MEIQMEQQEDLDVLYFQYLANLKNLILKLHNMEDVNCCKRWIEAFNNCRDDQKIVRNCLVSLMYQQLDGDGQLSDPFTDLSKIYWNFNNLFMEDDTQELVSTKTPLTSIELIDGLGSDGASETPRNLSQSVEAIPITNRHLAQIDDLTKFIVNMRNINHLLLNELKQVKREKSVLEMKVERKDIELRGILRQPPVETEDKSVMALSFPSPYGIEARNILSQRINSIIESYGSHKRILGGRMSGGSNYKQLSPKGDASISNALKVSESTFFDFLDNIAISLETYSRSVSSLSCKSASIPALRFLPESKPRNDVEMRVQVYERRIQQALHDIINNSRAQFAGSNVSSETIAVQTDSEAAFNLGRITMTRTTQTHKLYLKSSTDCESNRETMKMNLLRSCIYKLKKSRDKLAARYEKKLKEKSLQNEMQRKLWKLQLAAIRSHLQMNFAFRNQKELWEITEVLESRYKIIVSETFERLSKSAIMYHNN